MKLSITWTSIAIMHSSIVANIWIKMLLCGTKIDVSAFWSLWWASYVSNFSIASCFDIN